MKFGSVADPDLIDLTLPEDPIENKHVLNSDSSHGKLRLNVGFPVWNRAKLPDFYPRSTKNELAYYATQLNAIELNASFYRIFPKEQFAKWRQLTPPDFRFYPKLVQGISHWSRLKNTKRLVDECLFAFGGIEQKLGRVLLQLPDNFSPQHFNRVEEFITSWPKDVPLAIEFRHKDWFTESVISDNLFQLINSNRVTLVITDAPGRRDLLHMRLTASSVFIRFAGAAHASDLARLDEWADRLSVWADEGLTEIAFFLHQHAETESLAMAAYFIDKLNTRLGTELKIPGADVQ